jgi:hypothetical protein
MFPSRMAKRNRTLDLECPRVEAGKPGAVSCVE